jgi:hypothetical protein
VILEKSQQSANAIIFEPVKGYHFPAAKCESIEKNAEISANASNSMK